MIFWKLLKERDRKERVKGKWQVIKGKNSICYNFEY